MRGFLLSILRQAKSPTADCVPTSIKDSYAVWNRGASDPKSTSAMRYDDKADVIVVVNLMKKDGKAAKALLDALLASP